MPVLVERRTEPLHEADRTELARSGQRPGGNAQFLLDRRQEDPQHPRGEYTNVELPIESATTIVLYETVSHVLAGLTPREAKVLRVRFGIDMNTDQTLKEVGKQFDVTRERIRQIEADALRKLCQPSRSDMLRSFLNFE